MNCGVSLALYPALRKRPQRMALLTLIQKYILQSGYRNTRAPVPLVCVVCALGAHTWSEYKHIWKDSQERGDLSGLESSRNIQMLTSDGGGAGLQWRPPQWWGTGYKLVVVGQYFAYAWQLVFFSLS